MSAPTTTEHCLSNATVSSNVNFPVKLINSSDNCFSFKVSASFFPPNNITPQKQQVFFVNLQEIKGIKFGTRQPINYFDSFYNAELFLRAHGTYSIKIVDPLKFYAEAVPKNKDHVEIDEINEQYLSEFLEALQSSVNQMSEDGFRISFVSSD